MLVDISAYYNFDNAKELVVLSCIIWFTGISGSGKSTIASQLEKEFKKNNLKIANLDSDEVRENLSPHLGYTQEARDENTKRLAWMASQLAKYDVNVLVTAVSPLKKYRERAREMAEKINVDFIEVFVDSPIEICQKRDPKGLYKRVQAGEVNDIAGLHIPYERPDNPEIHLETYKKNSSECVCKIKEKLIEKKIM